MTKAFMQSYGQQGEEGDARVVERSEHAFQAFTGLFLAHALRHHRIHTFLDLAWEFLHIDEVVVHPYADPDEDGIERCIAETDGDQLGKAHLRILGDHLVAGEEYHGGERQEMHEHEVGALRCVPAIVKSCSAGPVRRMR